MQHDRDGGLHHRYSTARNNVKCYRWSFPANSGLDVTSGTFCHLASCTNPAGAGRAMKGPRTEPSAKRKRYNSRPLQSHFGGEAVSLPMHFAHSITVTVHLAWSDEVLVCAEQSSPSIRSLNTNLIGPPDLISQEPLKR